MGFNNLSGLLVRMEVATSISTILLIDVDVKSFSSYIFVPTPWPNHQNYIKKAPSLGNPSCSKLKFSFSIWWCLGQLRSLRASFTSYVSRRRCIHSPGDLLPITSSECPLALSSAPQLQSRLNAICWCLRLWGPTRQHI